LTEPKGYSFHLLDVSSSSAALATLSDLAFTRLTSLALLAPADLTLPHSFLATLSNLKCLSLLLSILDAPGRQFTHGPAFPSNNRVPYSLESFEIVVDAGSVPSTEMMLAIIGPKSVRTIKILAFSYKDRVGSLYTKLSFNESIVQILAKVSTSPLCHLIVDDWDQAIPFGLIHNAAALPPLPNLRKLVISRAGIATAGLKTMRVGF